MLIEQKLEKIWSQEFWTALLYMIEKVCKWMAFLKKYRNWQAIFNRWLKNVTIQRIFEKLQSKNIVTYTKYGIF